MAARLAAARCEPRSGVRGGHRLQADARGAEVRRDSEGARTHCAEDRRAEHIRRMAALRADVATALQLRRQHDRAARDDLRSARRVEPVHELLRRSVPRIRRGDHRSRRRRTVPDRAHRRGHSQREDRSGERAGDLRHSGDSRGDVAAVPEQGEGEGISHHECQQP